MSTSTQQKAPEPVKPAALLPGLEKEQGWSEQNAPELIKWDTPGETFMGILTAVTKVKVQGKMVDQYLLTLGDKRFTFLGSWDILQKLNSGHIGCQVRIKYLGKDPSVTGGASNQPMNRFSIQTKGTPTPQPQAQAGGPITDEDIPF